MNEPLLSVQKLSVKYGGIKAVQDVNFEVFPGEIVALVGANGAGKSSVLKAISGIVPWDGLIRFDGADLAPCAPHQITALGLIQVPEGRGIFGSLSVLENLKIATWARRNRTGISDDYEIVFALFPRLKERIGQPAGLLSGGEQQMLALGRALMSKPKLLLLDEPSMGLSPALVQHIYREIIKISAAGLTVLLVEQNVNIALHTATRAYLMANSCIVLQGNCDDLVDDPRIKQAYLGG